MIDISDLVSKLKERKVSRVALQLPEGLKRQSAGIAAILQEEGFIVVISGDPCYGACDLATDLLDMTDVLVHFGHSPLGDTPGVIYEIFSMDFDPDVLDLVIPYLTAKEIGIITTVQHAHLIPQISAYLSSKGIRCCIGEGGARTPYKGQVLGCSFGAARNCTADEILYIGGGEFHPLGALLATGKKIIAFDPYSRNISIISSERFLRRRFALIEKAKKAKTFGIIISLKTGQRRQELAEDLSDLKQGSVLVAMKEVSPDELQNLGFEAYVNTACPRLAFDDQERFPVPVLSPQEFMILCGKMDFSDYQIDEIT